MNPLHFGAEPNPLDGFDAAAGNAVDLSGFDRADGTLTVPAGIYVLQIEQGEVTRTRAGKPAYRLRTRTVEPEKHAGHVLWQWYLLDSTPNFNKAKAALAPLGMTTSAALHAIYPPIGAAVFIRAVVSLRHSPQYGPTNDIERFEVCDPPASARRVPNPFAVGHTREGGVG